MPMLKKLILLLLISACSTPQQVKAPDTKKVVAEPREFSHGELILGSALLTKIYDQEMAPLACIPDSDEAELLLRTIRPRMDIVQDDLEALLDDPKEVNDLIKTCDQNCTCGYVDELFREHLVPLSKEQRTTLNKKKDEKEVNRCLSFVQATFCQSDLYKTLNEEKKDFSYEE